jgi:UDP-N-acetyl-D-mannosaminuronate dehydrogenase
MEARKMETTNVAVVGLGEIGKPLLELIRDKYNGVGIDIDTKTSEKSFDIMHICYPYQIKNYVSVTTEYIAKYNPAITVINSTVAPGTTRKVHELTRKAIVHSPIRGKHIKMKNDLLFYTKFIGGIDEQASLTVRKHFESIGMKTKIFDSPESTELAKLTETTYFGMLIAWAQEIERYCDRLGLKYDEIVTFFEEIQYLPSVKFFPGVIGGHCVMQNIELLKSIFNSDILDSVEKSNNMKKMRETSA